MPVRTSSGKWRWGNVERDSKKELVQTVYGIWKKNGSKGSFSDFLKGTHESVEENAHLDLSSIPEDSMLDLDESFNFDKTNLYFHGSYDTGIKKIHAPDIYHPFCVTQDIEYALTFTEWIDDDDDYTHNGVIYAVTIDEDNLRIFDFGDESDLRKLNGRWPNRIVELFSNNHPTNRNPGEHNRTDPLMILDSFVVDWSTLSDDKNEIEEIKRLLNTFVLKRLNKKLNLNFTRVTNDNGSKFASYCSNGGDTDIVEFLRALLLTDLKELGFNGYVGFEKRGVWSENCYVLFDLDCLDKIYIDPIPALKAEKIAKLMDEKFKSYLDGDKDYKAHDAAIKAFIQMVKDDKSSKNAVKESKVVDNQLFFHGTKHIKSKLEKPETFKPFFVTKDVDYALSYAEYRKTSDDNAGIYLVKLNPNAKVFDPTNEEDFSKLEQLHFWELDVLDRLRHGADVLMVMDYAAHSILGKNRESKMGIQMRGCGALDFRDRFCKQLKDLGYSMFKTQEDSDGYNSDLVYGVFDIDGLDSLYPKAISLDEAKKIERMVKQRIPISRILQEIEKDEDQH